MHFIPLLEKIGEKVWLNLFKSIMYFTLLFPKVDKIDLKNHIK
jgi:hypothetical protein